MQRVIYRLKHSCLAPAILRWFAVGSFNGSFDILLVSFDIKALSSRGCRRENVKKQVAMKIKLQKIIFRLKHSCLVNCYDLWSVGIFHMDLLAYSRSLLTYSRYILT